MLLGQEKLSTAGEIKLEAPAALEMATTLSVAIVTINSTQKEVVSLWCNLLENFFSGMGVQAAKALLLSLMHQD